MEEEVEKVQEGYNENYFTTLLAAFYPGMGMVNLEQKGSLVTEEIPAHNKNGSQHSLSSVP